MARIKAKKCRCISSANANNGVNDRCGCSDVCINGLIGEAQMLPLTVPVIYDEIGINLCRSIELGVDVPTEYPTAVCATVQVLDVTFETTGEDAVTVEPIAGRPNCYTVTLTGLTVALAVKLYDSANRLLVTLPITTTYLSPSVDDPGYDEETNPGAVELEIYAPYGVAYEDATTEVLSLNFVGFLATNGTLAQGLNLMAAAKVLHFNIDESIITVGLSLYLSSIYYQAYRFCHEGKVTPPKGSVVPEEDSVCMEFVGGSLLDMQLKPLELGTPKFEELLKRDYQISCGGGFSTDMDCDTDECENMN